MQDTDTFTPAEQVQILNDATIIDYQLIAIQAHLRETGTIVPMRTLGHWEEMRLDQRHIVFAELREARRLATQWPEWDEYMGR